MVVLPAGGGGSLLLNDRHPASTRGSKRTNRARRIRDSLPLGLKDIGPFPDFFRSIILVWQQCEVILPGQPHLAVAERSGLPTVLAVGLLSWFDRHPSDAEPRDGC